MRYVMWALLAVCCAAAGCSEMQEVQNNGGRAINLTPTDRESRAGDNWGGPR